MKIHLHVEKGLLAGTSLWAQPGDTLGRKRAKILIEDPKVSGLHAEILFSPRGLEIVDRDSTHGLWVEGKRVSEAPLGLNTKFALGDTHFIVKEIQRSALEDLMIHSYHALDKAYAGPLSPPKMGRGAFNPILSLEFLQGPHEGERWTLGYGPRRIGTHSLDLLIVDPEAREECFSLHPHPEGALLTCPHEHFLRVNNRFTREKVLESNDTILFGQTLLKIGW